MAPVLRRVLETTEQAARRQSDSLAALAVNLLLVVAGVFLISHLRQEARLQDCVLSGGAGCAAQVAMME